jgi:DNA polymerase-3 subunit delta
VENSKLQASSSKKAPSSNPGVALICGDDEFAVKQRAKELYQKWSAELGGMDHEILDGQVNNSGEALKALRNLRAALQTLPFFGTGKVVWLQNCTFLGDERAASAAAVTEFLAELALELKTFQWGNVRLIVSAGKVDRRKTFYKTLEKVGTVQNFDAWSVDDKEWTYEAEELSRRELDARGKSISDNALAELVNNVGPNRRQMTSEIEKLSLYVGERPDIGVEDVRTIVTRNKQARAFALSEALGDRDLPRLLRTLDEELWEMKFDSQKSEIGILYGLISKVRAMIFVKEMMREGWIKADADYTRFKAQLERVPTDKLPQDKRFSPLAVNPYILYKAVPQAKKYLLAELVRAMDLLLRCNQQLIFSSLDGQLVLQQTLVQIVRGDGAPSVPR